MMIETKHLADPNALDDADRQPCEVWTRVMGYHRPVASFNTGKKGEHYERRFFREEQAHLENSGNRRLKRSRASLNRDRSTHGERTEDRA